MFDILKNVADGCKLGFHCVNCCYLKPLVVVVLYFHVQRQSAGKFVHHVFQRFGFLLRTVTSVGKKI